MMNRWIYSIQRIRIRWDEELRWLVDWIFVLFCFCFLFCFFFFFLFTACTSILFFFRIVRIYVLSLLFLLYNVHINHFFLSYCKNLYTFFAFFLFTACTSINFFLPYCKNLCTFFAFLGLQCTYQSFFSSVL